LTGLKGDRDARRPCGRYAALGEFDAVARTPGGKAPQLAGRRFEIVRAAASRALAGPEAATGRAQAGDTGGEGVDLVPTGVH